MYHRLFFYSPISYLLIVYLGSYPHLGHADTELVYTNQLNSVFGYPTIIQIQGSKVRMQRNGSNFYLLYDHDKHTLFNIDAKSQSFVRSDLETIQTRTRKLVDMQSQFTDQLKKQINDLPEAQRLVATKRLEQAQKMLTLPQPNVTTEYDTKTDLILGKPCKLARYKVLSQPIHEVCYAPHSVISETDLQKFSQMFDFMNELAAESARIQNTSKSTINLTSLVFETKLVLKNSNLSQNTVEELAEIKTTPLDQQLFTIPENYSELDPATTSTSMYKLKP